MISAKDIQQAQEAIKVNSVNPDIKNRLLFMLYAQAFMNGSNAVMAKWEEIMGPHQSQYKLPPGG